MAAARDPGPGTPVKNSDRNSQNFESVLQCGFYILHGIEIRDGDGMLMFEFDLKFVAREEDIKFEFDLFQHFNRDLSSWWII